MSGFTGMIYNSPQRLEKGMMQRTLIKQMELIRHRGPHRKGYLNDEFLSLGARSLHLDHEIVYPQPFSCRYGKIWVACSGNIYNYRELRQKLENEGYFFKTKSIPEIILALFLRFKENSFQYLRGMFAIVVWDKENQTLYGARDPFGIKPFYYYESKEYTAFASEKKCLSILPNDPSVNQTALHHYLSFQYVPEPMTMIKDIKKLKPGHYFIKKPRESMLIKSYATITFNPILQERQTWIKQIQNAMFDSVKAHIKDNNSVGALLSGGIDSTLLVSIAKNFNPQIKTFSVGFEREGFSEVDVAKQTADKLALKNFSYRITPQKFVTELPKIIWHLDDPLADPSCVPLYFIARKARKHVTAVLSGEGSDEIFGGYNIYREPQALKIFKYIPQRIKRLLAKIKQIIPDGVKGKSFIERGITPLQNRYIGNAKIFEDEDKKYILKSHNERLSYRQITAELFNMSSDLSQVHQMQFIDIHTWLRGDILLKADKMAMANSLELRTPFLDKEVFKVASKIPTNLTIAHGSTKHILREAAKGIVPEHVLHRKKLGFPVPIRHWLKEELYDWAKQLIHESETDYLLCKSYILKLLDDHCQGKMDYSRQIWTVLSFMLWHQIFIENKYEFHTVESKTEIPQNPIKHKSATIYS